MPQNLLTGNNLPVGASLPHVQMDAFNIIPGATFAVDSPIDSGFTIWCAVHVSRDIARERVFVWARRGDEITENHEDSVQNRSFDLDYCDTVGLVGIILNPTDPDDNNWGHVS